MTWQAFADLVVAGARLLGEIDRRFDGLEERVAALEGTPTPPPTRVATDWPFTSGAWFNSPLCDGLDYTDTSDPRTAQLRSFGAGTINSTDWSYPVYIGESTDPLVTCTEFDNYGNETGHVEVVHLRADAHPCGPNSTDYPLLAVDDDGVRDVELYKFSWIEPGISARSTRIEVVDLTGDGTETGACASSTPAIGGLIRPEEFAAGYIGHRLKMSAPDALLKVGEVWPAKNEDGNAETAYKGLIPMGSLLALPPDLNLSAVGLTSSEGLAIAHALQDFGGHVLVRASTVCLFVEATHVDKEAVKRATEDYKRLIPYLVVVDGASASAPGGPGVPRVPAIPDLAA